MTVALRMSIRFDPEIKPLLLLIDLQSHQMLPIGAPIERQHASQIVLGSQYNPPERPAGQIKLQEAQVIHIKDDQAGQI